MDEYIQARKSQLNFYKDVPLYSKVSDNRFVVYKPTGITIGEMRIQNGRHPDVLYIKQTDKIKGIQEAQKAFNMQLEIAVKSRNSEKVRETLVTIVEETLTEPRCGSLEGVSETVGILVYDYSNNIDGNSVIDKHVIKRLLYYFALCKCDGIFSCLCLLQ